MLSIQNQVAWIKLNRPEQMNALNNSLKDDLLCTLHEVAQLEEVKLTILWGGENIFCAGLDIKEGLATRLESYKYKTIQLALAFYNHPHPVLAAVGGHAIGAGFDLAFYCDLIIAEPAAQFLRPEVFIGMSAAKLIFCKKFAGFFDKHSINTGKKHTGKELWQDQMISYISSPGNLTAGIYKIIEQFSDNSVDYTRALKEHFRMWLGEDFCSLCRQEQEVIFASLTDEIFYKFENYCDQLEIL